MKNIVFLCGLVLALSLNAFAQGGDAKAQEIVKKARAVIGKEDKIKALQNFVAEGVARQSQGQSTQENQMELTFASPDKLARAVTRSFGPAEFTTIEIMNGQQTWMDVSSNQPMPGGGPGGRQGGMRGGMMGMVDQATQDNLRFQDMTRTMLAFFLAAPGVDYTYVGEAKAPDGTIADIIGAKGPHDFFAKLYIERESHQLLMIGYKGKDTRALFRGPGQGGQPGQPGQRGQAGQPGQPGQPGAQNAQTRQAELDKLPPEEREKRMAEMRARQEARAAEMKAAWDKAPEVDFQWSVADYKPEGGLNLPHKLTRSVGGQAMEEWAFTKFKINEKNVKAEKFEKKEK